MQALTKTNCYQRYTTAFKLNVVLSSDSALFRKFIPGSTISYWKKQNFEKHLGFDLEQQSERRKEIFKAVVRSRKYERACRGLLVMLELYDHLLSSTRKRKFIFRKNREKIISCFDELKKYFKVSTIEKRLHISGERISRWKAEGRCKLSMLKLCITLNPLQLTFEEQMRLKNFFFEKESFFLPINHIWAKAQRNGLMLAKETVYKYHNEMFGKRERKKQVKNKVSIHASRPFDILHMDSTPLVLKNKEKVYIHFVMDNYSRAVLRAVVSHSSRSVVVVDNLRGVLKKHNLFYKPFELYCDGGPENEGEVNGLLNEKNIRIKKIVANYLDETTNNMAEAWHRKFKQVVLKMYDIRNAEDLSKKIPEMIEFANRLYLPVLKTLSPNEAIAGKEYESLKCGRANAASQNKKNRSQ